MPCLRVSLTFLEFYNLKRSHQGYRLKGRTPAQALRERPRPKEASTHRPEGGH